MRLTLARRWRLQKWRHIIIYKTNLLFIRNQVVIRILYG